jgi:flagellar protein FliS
MPQGNQNPKVSEERLNTLKFYFPPPILECTALKTGPEMVLFSGPSIQGGAMAYTNALSAYKETRIRTASQGQLIIMLYDEAVKQLDRGLELMGLNVSGKKDPARIESIGKAIVKARDIITELMVSLDFEQGGEIAKNLFALYAWFNKELLEAHMGMDISRIAAVKNMIHNLREAWVEIAAKTSAEGRPAEGVNIAG